MHPRISPRSRVLLAVALIGIMVPAQASATIAERGSFHDEFSDTFSDCGFDVAVDVVADGQYRIREGSGADASAFLLLSRVTWREVHTANGTSITLTGQSLYNEPQAVRIEGSIFEFTSIEAGQPFAIYDAAGALILRDRGVIRHTYLFDTEGDDVPGGLFIEDVDVQISGPHPSFDLPFEQYCALFG
jgi:hypothetical protein